MQAVEKLLDSELFNISGGCSGGCNGNFKRSGSVNAPRPTPTPSPIFVPIFVPVAVPSGNLLIGSLCYAPVTLLTDESSSNAVVQIGNGNVAATGDGASAS